MQAFTYQAQPTRVIFGRGTCARLAEEAEGLGLSRLLVLCTPGQARLGQQAEQWLGGLAAGRFAGAVMHTPVDATERAMQAAQDLRADGVVAIGGGSAIGLGKAIALRTDLPQIVLPTTYAGSEMTPILGETRDGVKTTQRGPRILPEVVIYDVDLTLTLPTDISALSAFNAIAHAAEALYAPDGNPVTALMAEEGVSTLARALPRLMQSPDSARADMLYGAWLCSCCLGATTMGLHHKLCHVLGGLFDLPHAQTHTVVLPHALALNAPAVPEAMARLARALGADDPVGALFALQAGCRVPTALRDLGMPRDGIARAVDLAMAQPYRNPRPVAAADLTALFKRAWSGVR